MAVALCLNVSQAGSIVRGVCLAQTSWGQTADLVWFVRWHVSFAFCCAIGAFSYKTLIIRLLVAPRRSNRLLLWKRCTCTWWKWHCFAQLQISPNHLCDSWHVMTGPCWSRLCLCIRCSCYGLSTILTLWKSLRRWHRLAIKNSTAELPSIVWVSKSQLPVTEVPWCCANIQLSLQQGTNWDTPIILSRLSNAAKLWLQNCVVCSRDQRALKLDDQKETKFLNRTRFSIIGTASLHNCRLQAS